MPSVYLHRRHPHQRDTKLLCCFVRSMVAGGVSKFLHVEATAREDDPSCRSCARRRQDLPAIKKTMFPQQQQHRPCFNLFWRGPMWKINRLRLGLAWPKPVSSSGNSRDILYKRATAEAGACVSGAPPGMRDVKFVIRQLPRSQRR